MSATEILDDSDKVILVVTKSADGRCTFVEPDSRVEILTASMTNGLSVGTIELGTLNEKGGAGKRCGCCMIKFGISQQQEQPGERKYFEISLVKGGKKGCCCDPTEFQIYDITLPTVILGKMEKEKCPPPNEKKSRMKLTMPEGEDMEMKALFLYAAHSVVSQCASWRLFQISKYPILLRILICPGC